MALNIPFTSITLWPDPEPADYLPPELDAEGYYVQIGDIVSIGNRAGMVYGTAMPSPFYGVDEWQVYVGNMPGQSAWSDYWDVQDIEIIKYA